MSAKSFASTLIETPALHQDMPIFPHTSLEVNVEDEEGERGFDNTENYGSDGSVGIEAKKGRKSHTVAATNGKSVTELKKKYENATREVSDLSNEPRLYLGKMQSFRIPSHMTDVTLRADIPDESRPSLNTPPNASALTSITSSESKSKKEHEETLQGLGLGLACLNKNSDADASWQADMERLEKIIDAAENTGDRSTPKRSGEGKQQALEA
ncbi:hypothetical protein QFC19_003934 [Naganishia cerealis]|uniref:Uncharacterized protein n=1 Tax=Naganishia cerealis TaxID=610337 RepID=A0ACC2W083_9TREE|nr:hypothetical protein QFC19_003934 [Naganishia cerealis]